MVAHPVVLHDNRAPIPCSSAFPRHNLPHLVQIADLIPDRRAVRAGQALGVVPAAGDARPAAALHVAGQGVPDEEQFLPVIGADGLQHRAEKVQAGLLRRSGPASAPGLCECRW